MHRAYTPSRATRNLTYRIAALPGVIGVGIIAPHRGATVTPARLRITTEGATYDLTLMQARWWADMGTPAPRPYGPFVEELGGVIRSNAAQRQVDRFMAYLATVAPLAVAR